MKKKIAILGSTGSIGKTTLDIISENRKSFKLILISTNKNFKKLFFQVKKFKVKKIMIIRELIKKNATANDMLVLII